MEPLEPTEPMVVVYCLDCGQQATVLLSRKAALLGRWQQDHDAVDKQLRDIEALIGAPTADE